MLRPKGPMRDRHADRMAGEDPKFPGRPTPSGTVGPSGVAIDRAQGEGGALEPDPPEEPG
jgi:hypothetical protein